MFADRHCFFPIFGEAAIIFRTDFCGPLEPDALEQDPRTGWLVGTLGAFRDRVNAMFAGRAPRFQFVLMQDAKDDHVIGSVWFETPEAGAALVKALEAQADALRDRLDAASDAAPLRSH